MNKTEANWIINDRVDGVYSDLRGFVYIRQHSLQNSAEQIGGGNITQAMALFSLLNFLAKIQYFLDKDGVLECNESGEPKIVEESAFIHLVRKIDAQGIRLGLPCGPRDTDTLKLVWSGFRNKLAHVSNPEWGKQVTVFVFTYPSERLSVSGFLDQIKNEPCFEHDGNQRNWHVNADILLANIPAIKRVITGQIDAADEDNLYYELLEKVIG